MSRKPDDRKQDDDLLTPATSAAVKAYRIQIAPVKAIMDGFITDPETSALIICSSRVSRLGRARYAQNFCAVSFDDVTDPDKNSAISSEQAEMIAAFVRGLDEKVEKLYISCDGGESRSPALAAAILRASGRSDDCIWENPYYFPNYLVFYRLCQAFGVSVTWVETLMLSARNKQAYRDVQALHGQTNYRRWEEI